MFGKRRVQIHLRNPFFDDRECPVKISAFSHFPLRSGKLVFYGNPDVQLLLCSGLKGFAGQVPRAASGFFLDRAEWVMDKIPKARYLLNFDT
jgi:hypothetical protein